MIECLRASTPLQETANPCIPGGGISAVPFSDRIKFGDGGPLAGPSISDNIGFRFGFA